MTIPEKAEELRLSFDNIFPPEQIPHHDRYSAQCAVIYLDKRMNEYTEKSPVNYYNMKQMKQYLMEKYILV